MQNKKSSHKGKSDKNNINYIGERVNVCKEQSSLRCQRTYSSLSKKEKMQLDAPKVRYSTRFSSHKGSGDMINSFIIILAIIIVMLVAVATFVGSVAKHERIIFDEIELMRAKNTFYLMNRSVGMTWFISTVQTIYKAENGIGETYWYVTNPQQRKSIRLPDSSKCNTGNPSICLPRNSDVADFLKNEMQGYLSIKGSDRHAEQELRLNDVRVNIEDIDINSQHNFWPSYDRITSLVTQEIKSTFGASKTQSATESSNAIFTLFRKIVAGGWLIVDIATQFNNATDNGIDYPASPGDTNTDNTYFIYLGQKTAALNAKTDEVRAWLLPEMVSGFSINNMDMTVSTSNERGVLPPKKGLVLFYDLGAQYSEGTVPPPPVTGSGCNSAITAQVLDDAFQEKNSHLQGLGSCMMAAQQATRVPAILMAAIPVVEGGWAGTTMQRGNCPSTGAPSNNLYSIKGSGCPWNVWECRDRDIGGCRPPGAANNRCGSRYDCDEQANFKVYSSKCDSVNDFAGYISTAPRYAEAMRYTDNPAQMVTEINEAGYATDQSWANKVIRIMNEICSEVTVPPSELQIDDVGGAHPGINYRAANREADGNDISKIVIHTCEGSYNDCINALRTTAEQKGAHYVVSRTGRIARVVQDKDIAFHAGHWDTNVQSIGIEHEGRAGDPNTWTPELLQASSRLSKWLSTRYGIPIDRSHIIGHNEVPGCPNPGGGGSRCHADPGPYLDWNNYISMVNSATTASASLPVQSSISVASTNPPTPQASYNGYYYHDEPNNRFIRRPFTLSVRVKDYLSVLDCSNRRNVNGQFNWLTEKDMACSGNELYACQETAYLSTTREIPGMEAGNKKTGTEELGTSPNILQCVTDCDETDPSLCLPIFCKEHVDGINPRQDLKQCCDKWDWGSLPEPVWRGRTLNDDGSTNVDNTCNSMTYCFGDAYTDKDRNEICDYRNVCPGVPTEQDAKYSGCSYYCDSRKRYYCKTDATETCADGQSGRTTDPRSDDALTQAYFTNNRCSAFCGAHERCDDIAPGGCALSSDTDPAICGSTPGDTYCMPEACPRRDCDAWAYRCSNNDVWRSRTCYDTGCLDSRGGCYLDSRNEDERYQVCGSDEWTGEYRCGGNRERKVIRKGCSTSTTACYSNEEWVSDPCPSGQTCSGNGNCNSPPTTTTTTTTPSGCTIGGCGTCTYSQSCTTSGGFPGTQSCSGGHYEDSSCICRYDGCDPTGGCGECR